MIVAVGVILYTSSILIDATVTKYEKICNMTPYENLTNRSQGYVNMNCSGGHTNIELLET